MLVSKNQLIDNASWNPKQFWYARNDAWMVTFHTGLITHNPGINLHVFLDETCVEGKLGKSITVL